MGNDQSQGVSSSNAGNVNFPADSNSAIGGGITSSLSFLVRKRTSLRSTSSVVVVNVPLSSDLSEDETLCRMKQIPTFSPLLRINRRIQQEPLDIFSKIDPIHINNFLKCLKNHFYSLSISTSNKQNELLSKLSEVDRFVSSLLKRSALQQKLIEQITTELERIDTLAQQLCEIHCSLTDKVIPELEELNNLLTNRLPHPKDLILTSFSSTPPQTINSKSSRVPVEPIEELKVIDKET